MSGEMPYSKQWLLAMTSSTSKWMEEVQGGGGGSGRRGGGGGRGGGDKERDKSWLLAMNISQVSASVAPHS